MEKFVDIAYLIAAVSFIYGLKMLSHPKTARNGNLIASIGMLIAIIATVVMPTEKGQPALSLQMIGIAMVIGSIIGAFFAIRVQMTQMPQLVAIFNGFGGGASALVAASEYLKSQENLITASVEGKTLIDFIDRNAEEYPNYPALNTPANSEYSAWDSISWSE